jgi:hypothetical protein
VKCVQRACHVLALRPDRCLEPVSVNHVQVVTSSITVLTTPKLVLESLQGE